MVSIHPPCRKSLSQVNLPGPLLAPKDDLTNIAHILNLRMPHAELPKTDVSFATTLEHFRTYHTMSDVYSTIAATNTVNINPGTNPRVA